MPDSIMLTVLWNTHTHTLSFSLSRSLPHFLSNRREYSMFVYKTGLRAFVRFDSLACVYVRQRLWTWCVMSHMYVFDIIIITSRLCAPHQMVTLFHLSHSCNTIFGRFFIIIYLFRFNSLIYFYCVYFWWHRMKSRKKQLNKSFNITHCPHSQQC